MARKQPKFQLGDILTIVPAERASHGLPNGQIVKVTSVDVLWDMPEEGSTSIDPISYGVTAVDPVPGVLTFERYIASDEAEKA